MSNERTRNNKNKKQRDSNTSESNSSNAYARKFAKALRGAARGSKENSRVREGTKSIQGDYTARFWEDGWNE